MRGVSDVNRRTSLQTCRKTEYIQAGSARLARGAARGRRGAGDQRRRARNGNRRHRRPLHAQDGQPRGAVRRRPRLSARPSHSREHPDLGAADQSHARPAARRLPHRARLLLAQIHEGGEEHPAGHGRERAGDGERLHRQGHRYPENPDAALARARRRLLHRHRLHGDHEGSRHRLDQLRRLPHPVARPEPGDRDVLQGQARRPDQAPISRARRAVPDRGRGRHASRRCSWWRGWRFPTARTNTTSPAG